MAQVKAEQRTASRKISLYPGCSLTSSAREMGESFEEIARMLDIEVISMEDWNCCGSSPAHSTNQGYALLLAARNLLLAQRQGIEELMVMCPSCFVRLREAEKAVKEDEKKAQQVKDAFGQAYEGRVRLRFFLEILTGVGLDALKEKVTQPLKGIQCAMYYGCLLTRPEWITGFDVEPYEESLNEIVRALGAEPVKWALSRQCCGAHLAVTKPEVADGLVDRIKDFATRAGANCLVVFCPLCQVNLELRGTNSKEMPVLYIQELIGLAVGIPKCRQWLKRHLVDPIPLLTSLGLKIP
jgi:heterodisulfide reductase subunit B